MIITVLVTPLEMPHCSVYQVLERILAGMVPRFGGSLVDKFSPSPDLYGPFWLAISLTLTVALSHNLSRLLQFVLSLTLCVSYVIGVLLQRHGEVGISFSRSDIAGCCNLCLLIFNTFYFVVDSLVEG